MALSSLRIIDIGKTPEVEIFWIFRIQADGVAEFYNGLVKLAFVKVGTAPLVAGFSFSHIFGGERLRGKRGAGRAAQYNCEQQICGRLNQGGCLPHHKGCRSVY